VKLTQGKKPVQVYRASWTNMNEELVESVYNTDLCAFFSLNGLWFSTVGSLKDITLSKLVKRSRWFGEQDETQIEILEWNQQTCSYLLHGNLVLHGIHIPQQLANYCQLKQAQEALLGSGGVNQTIRVALLDHGGLCYTFVRPIAVIQPDSIPWIQIQPPGSERVEEIQLCGNRIFLRCQDSLLGYDCPQREWVRYCELDGVKVSQMVVWKGSCLFVVCEKGFFVVSTRPSFIRNTQLVPISFRSQTVESICVISGFVFVLAEKGVLVCHPTADATDPNQWILLDTFSRPYRIPKGLKITSKRIKSARSVRTTDQDQGTC